MKVDIMATCEQIESELNVCLHILIQATIYVLQLLDKRWDATRVDRVICVFRVLDLFEIVPWIVI